MIVRLCGSALYLYCQNNNYNVVALTDKDGVVVEKVKYDPYGMPTCIRTSDSHEQTASHYGNPYLFQGRRSCSETNLYYFRNRYMSPTLGRFMQRDPLGYVDGMSLYEFVGGTPTHRVDAEGLKNREKADWAAKVKDALQKAKGFGALADEARKMVQKREPPKPKPIRYVDRVWSSKPPEPVPPYPRHGSIFQSQHVGAVVAVADLVVEALIDGLDRFSSSRDCMEWYRRTARCLKRAKSGDCCCCDEINDFAAGEASRCSDVMAKVNAPAGGLYSAFKRLADKLAKKCHEQCAQ